MKNEILQHLPGDFPWQVHWFPVTGSTNDLAKELALHGAPHGTCILADSQTKGRGRMGRQFLSPTRSGIYLSVILRPSCRAEALLHLTCAVGTVMCDAVEEVTGFRPHTKWINDLIAGGKKLGGILTELSLKADGTVEYCVIGIGINCRRAPLPPSLVNIATSLEEVTGQVIDRAVLAAAMIRRLADMDLGQKAALMARYRNDCVTLGKDILLLQNDCRQPAHALDIDSDGGLTVRLPDGSVQTVRSGEVSVRGMDRYT